MTAGVLLLTVAGLLIAGGVVGAVSAARGVTVLPAAAPARAVLGRGCASRRRIWSRWPPAWRCCC